MFWRSVPFEVFIAATMKASAEITAAQRGRLSKTKVPRPPRRTGTRHATSTIMPCVPYEGSL